MTLKRKRVAWFFSFAVLFLQISSIQVNAKTGEVAGKGDFSVLY